MLFVCADAKETHLESSDEEKDLVASILALSGPERYWKPPGANTPDMVPGETLGESSTGGDPFDVDGESHVLCRICT